MHKTLINFNYNAQNYQKIKILKNKTWILIRKTVKYFDNNAKKC